MSQMLTVNSMLDNDATGSTTAQLRVAQRQWAAENISHRLRILRGCRHLIAERAEQLVDAIDLPQRRDRAESIAAEVFPLADAIRFLERNALRLLRPKKESRRDRPSWGRGLDVVTHRDPLGVVLIIGTWNYPLFLTGVQLIQALVAGNAVIVKPGLGCFEVTRRLIELLFESGLPRDLVSLRSEEADSAQQAIVEGVDKVVFTGSAATGRLVMGELAKHGTPSVMELSGSDAVFILPNSDLVRVAKCLLFGMQINAGATCIAPRRVYGSYSTIETIKQTLLSELQDKPPVPVHAPAGKLAVDLITSNASGAKLLTPSTVTNWSPGELFPFCLLEVENPNHLLLHSDVFAPVMSLIPVADMEDALRQNANCPYALGASVFGRKEEAQEFAARIDAGCVVINDIVAPTADPRVAFGGRRSSGFGSTRGAAGLLEMTQVKAIVTQGSNWLPHLEPPIPELGPLLFDFLRLSHARGWREKWLAARGLMQSGRAYWTSSRTSARKPTQPIKRNARETQ